MKEGLPGVHRELGSCVVEENVGAGVVVVVVVGIDGTGGEYPLIVPG